MPWLDADGRWSMGGATDDVALWKKEDAHFLSHAQARERREYGLFCPKAGTFECRVLAC